jgi:hypothetical protein
MILSLEIRKRRNAGEVNDQVILPAGDEARALIEASEGEAFVDEPLQCLQDSMA